MSRLDSMRSKLEACGQSPVLQHMDALDGVAREAFVRRLESLPLDAMPALIEQLVMAVPSPSGGDLQPADCVCVDPDQVCGSVSLIDVAPLRARGEAMLADGRVAAFTVAGGQGTRLGWNGPKGTFPATPVTGKPLFRLFAEQIMAAQRQWGRTIRWYLMTSETNDAETRAFFLDNRCFGLDRRQIMMFPQGMMPAFDKQTGHLLMDGPGSLAMSPDGHGGSFHALLASGAIDQMEGRGVEAISYFQVDNPLAPVLDPVFLGLHADEAHSSGEFTSKMVSKIGPDEKVGVFGAVDGHLGVVEYSDLSQAQACSVDHAGRLRFAAGNVALHVISTDFARRVATAGADDLPWHRAVKKVPHIDPASGKHMSPSEPNAIKLERFVFDAMGIASKPAILEVKRVEQFAPIKNATGTDSAESSKQLQSDLYGSWLEQAGVQIPRREDGHADAAIEISPLTSMGAQMLTGVDLPVEIPRGGSFAC
jgi:UDP-N-acetylglucosamine/UDP-N-acetylgalactosamine diphosphorylase